MKVFVIILLACLAASASTMAINKSEVAEIDPKIINFMIDFYNQLVAEPINTLASALASMTVHLVAGISQEGLAGFGKREVDQKVLNDLVNNLQSALYDLANQSVQQLALSLTQLLANFGLNGVGKREVDQKVLNDLVNNLNSALYDLANQSIQQLALSLTQLLANFGLNGVGKREVPVKGFGDDLLNTLLTGLYPIGDQLVQSVGTALTQILLSFGGKREVEQKFLDELIATLQSGLYGLANQTVQQLALSLTQLLANFGLNGVGKREVPVKGFGDDLWNTLLTGLYPIGDQLVQSVGTALTQILLSFGGKRSLDDKGITDLFSNIGNGLYNGLDSLVQSTAYQLALFLLHVSENGLLPTIPNFGKRQIPVRPTNKGFGDDLLNTLLTGLYPIGDQLVQNIGTALTQILLSFGGKRDLSVLTSSTSIDHFIHNILTLISQTNLIPHTGNGSNIIG